MNTHRNRRPRCLKSSLAGPLLASAFVITYPIGASAQTAGPGAPQTYKVKTYKAKCTADGSVIGLFSVPQTGGAKVPGAFLIGDSPAVDLGDAKEVAAAADTSLRALARGLAKRGTAALYCPAVAPTGTQTFDDKVLEAQKNLARLCRDKRFNSCVAIGQGDGALTALLAAQKVTRANGVAAINAPARSIPELLKTQMAPPVTSEALYPEALRVVDELSAGDANVEIPAELQKFFPENLKAYLASLFKHDTSAEIKKFKGKILYTNGTRVKEVPDTENDIASILGGKRVAACDLPNLSRTGKQLKPVFEGYAFNPYAESDAATNLDPKAALNKDLPKTIDEWIDKKKPPVAEKEGDLGCAKQRKLDSSDSKLDPKAKNRSCSCINPDKQPVPVPTKVAPKPTRKPAPVPTKASPKPTRKAAPTPSDNEGYAFQVALEKNGHEDKRDTVKGSEEILTGDTAQLPCLSNVLKRCGADDNIQKSRADRVGYRGERAKNINTDEVCDRTQEGNKCDNFDHWLTPNHYDDCVAQQFNKDAREFEFHPTGFRYVDTSCKPVPAEDVTCLCGDVYVRYIASPISLIWKEGVRIEEQENLVRFPLDPERAGRWFEWRGSSETPLLVYDPSHKGEITTASQLFGNHTFGKSWKHGYEALATLDGDRSGDVSGKELESLGLWFDANRNGVSEKGEVKTLAESGVTTLRYGPVATDSGARVASLGTFEPGRSKYVRVENGYTRMEGGRALTLPSVDWFGEGYESKMDALGQRR